MEILTKNDLARLFQLLNEELKKESSEGEIYLVGGAVMCLVFQARPSTKDVDAFFKPAQKMREAAAKVAVKIGLKKDWLNDAVKGYLSQKISFDSFLELSHLKIFTARADYLLAMKCLAMRIGEEFHDFSDIRFLLRYLNVDSTQEAVGIITQYYPMERFPQKTFYALEEIFDESRKKM